MKQIRVACISFSCVFAILATIAILLPSHVHAQRSATDVRIDAIDGRVHAMEGYGERITRVEDQTREISSQISEITAWARGIGLALCGAVLERLLRAMGIRIKGASEP